MSKTLLAVDDSATMREVLEITFAGESFRVLTADNAANAVAKMREEPTAAVIDTSLGADDGYALAKDLRARDGRLAVILMASRHAPYDANRGKDAGVDDYIDKPFDTQALIDKVKKALLARESSQGVAPAPAAVSAGPAMPHAGSPAVAGSRVPVQPFSAAPVKPGGPAPRMHTMAFEGPPTAPQPPSSTRIAPPGFLTQPMGSRPAPRPAPAPAPAAAPPATPAAPAASAAPAVNGQMAEKLKTLGLTAQQVDAVLALSREVVERVVWEVVPVLAETLIQEEIARLTKD